MVSGWVDADNSFGANIRTYFAVTLTLTEDGYKDANCYFGEDSITAIAQAVVEEHGFDNETGKDIQQETESEEHLLYEKAVKEYNNEKYSDALIDFMKCQQYKDATDYILKIQDNLYNMATDAIQEADYDEAINLLEQISDYKDADILLQTANDEKNYIDASNYYSEKNYDEALRCLAQLSEPTDKVDILKEQIYEGKAVSCYYSGDIDESLKAISKMKEPTEQVNEIQDEIADFQNRYAQWLGKWGYSADKDDYSLWIRATYKEGLTLAFESGKTTAGDAIVYDLNEYNENSLVYHSDRYDAFSYTTLTLVGDGQLECVTKQSNTDTTVTKTMYRID
jgi:tetratricopeptide (TPR) repeat protein